MQVFQSPTRIPTHLQSFGSMNSMPHRVITSRVASMRQNHRSIATMTGHHRREILNQRTTIINSKVVMDLVRKHSGHSHGNDFNDFSSIKTALDLPPKPAPTYNAFGRALVAKTRLDRWKYWSTFAGITLLGTGAAEIGLQYAGLPPASGLSFLAATGGAAILQYGIIRFTSHWVPMTMGGREINANVSDPAHRQVYNMVEEMVHNANLPYMPKVFIVPTEEKNAFAAGLSPKSSSVSVTEGIMKVLTPEELRAVIGHEVGHLANGDSITSLHLIAINAGFYAAFRLGMQMMRSSQRGGKNNNHLIGMALMGVGLASYGLGTLYQLFISRSRELTADACAVAYTADNTALGTALKKIESGNAKIKNGPLKDRPEMSHLFISSPVPLSQRFFQLFSTHPTTDERLKKLATYTPANLQNLKASLPLPKNTTQASRLITSKSTSKGWNSGSSH